MHHRTALDLPTVGTCAHPRRLRNTQTHKPKTGIVRRLCGRENPKRHWMDISPRGNARGPCLVSAHTLHVGSNLFRDFIHKVQPKHRNISRPRRPRSGLASCVCRRAMQAGRNFVQIRGLRHRLTQFVWLAITNIVFCVCPPSFPSPLDAISSVVPKAWEPPWPQEPRERCRDPTCLDVSSCCWSEAFVQRA